MIKKLIMKLLGIETAAERLARLEANHAKLKETIDRTENAIDRLELLLSRVPAGATHRESVEGHLALASTRLDLYRKAYAEGEVVLQIARLTLEADKAMESFT